MQESKKSPDRILPALALPSHIEAEILKAKEKFLAKYGIDPASGLAASDDEFDYPVNWYDLMNHDLFMEMQTLEGNHQDICACLEMGWQREDYYNSPQGKWEMEEQKRLKEEFDKGLAKLRAYTGKEPLLLVDLRIPYLGFAELSDIREEVIGLAVKFGYDCPFSAEEMNATNRFASIDKSHKAFKKYEDELYGDDFVEITDLLQWEYEDAMEHLSKFVPKGYYLYSEEEFGLGWGIYKDGELDFDGPEY